MPGQGSVTQAAMTIRTAGFPMLQKQFLNRTLGFLVPDPGAPLQSVSMFIKRHKSATVMETIRREVIPFVRQLSALSAEVQSKALGHAQTDTTNEFLLGLSSSWYAHNALAHKIDRFLVQNIAWSELRVLNAGIPRAISLYSAATKAEHKKRVFSAGVKGFLETNLPRLAERYRLTSVETNDLVSLGVPDFWNYCLGEHLRFLALKRDDAKHRRECEKHVIRQFHAGIRECLMQRIGDVIPAAHLTNTEFIAKQSGEYLQLLTAASQRRVKLIYLTMERPELREFNKIVEYDNFIEHLYGYRLMGFPDLLLRMAVRNTLVEKGLIDWRPSVLLYAEQELEYLLHALVQTHE